MSILSDDAVTGDVDRSSWLSCAGLRSGCGSPQIDLTPPIIRIGPCNEADGSGPFGNRQSGCWKIGLNATRCEQAIDGHGPKWRRAENVKRIWPPKDFRRQKGIDMFKKTATTAKQESRTSPATSDRKPTAPRTTAPANAAIPHDVIPHDAIAQLAFENWQKHGCPVGEDQRDWFEAERELNSPPAGNARRG